MYIYVHICTFMYTYMYILRFPACTTMLRSRTWSRLRYINQSVLQCVAVCCSVLQCVTWCSVVQCGAVWCSVLQSVTVCCIVENTIRQPKTVQDHLQTNPLEKYIWNENQIRTHVFIVCTYSDSSGICSGKMQETKEDRLHC